ncbi:MarR family transcriptional regulator [Micromonospora sp. NPDC049679]|uniref:MarR family winged helix-turn-helix transcriptional regulator n=1 Tax=Micromonospora sp. NPDC049679 TaxID=3155920 RepID=UPI0033E334E0
MTTTGASPRPGTGERGELAGQVVRRIVHVARAMRHDTDLGFARLGLTPAVARALHQLDPDRPIAARELAEQLECDRSNVTALVDKLELAGLVHRQVDPADRRLKTLVVTDAGRGVRDQVHQVMSEARLLAGLSDDELGTLRELLGKVSDGGCPEDCGGE